MADEKKPPLQLSEEKVIATRTKPPGLGGAHIVVKPDSVKMGGGADEPDGNKNSIALTKDSGTIIVGPLAIITEPHNIRIGLQNELNDVLTSGIPSSALTPIPVMNFTDDQEMMKMVKDAMKAGLELIEEAMKLEK